MSPEPDVARCYTCDTPAIWAIQAAQSDGRLVHACDTDLAEVIGNLGSMPMTRLTVWRWQ